VTNESAGTPALELRGLRKRFGGLAAVDDLSLAIPENSIYGLMGPNGAGKTTILNLITGFLSPDEGQVLVDGQDITGQPAHQVAAHGVARSYQNVRLFPGLTVLETVISGFHRHRSSRIWQAVLATRAERRERREYAERARELLHRVGVSAPPERVGTTLPYGEQRRLEIARALATDPRLLLLDEPTAGMNAAESAAIGDLLRQLQSEQLTLVLIEHNIKLVLEYCEHAAVVDFGRLLIEDVPSVCVADPNVQEAYFGKSSDAERLEAVLELRSDQSGN
jgi:branched-chain amino acid transport system ATP-binding protein